jgi:molybdopterin-guanine dinucleotide biosynthesis protein A
VKHQKHKNLVKPIGGKFGRNEISILGAPCGEIKKLVAELGPLLNTELALAYVDADHHAPKTDDWSALDYGIPTQLTNKISHYSLDSKESNDHYFNDADLVLVNGNHFKAENQIAWIHPDKSLEKKLEKLQKVSLIILEDEMDVPDYINDHLANQPYKTVLRTEVEKIVKHLQDFVVAREPRLNGLVLVGGKSTRMKKDKSRLIFHDNKPQYVHLGAQVGKICKEVYTSVRDDEQGEHFQVPYISDKFIGLGPFGGILSAFQENPNAAWLVVAVDLPFLDQETLELLVKKRNKSKVATCFIDPNNEFPEPLITIWEPRAYPILLNYLAKGYSCPRKVLINSDVELIKERNARALTNVNNPDELDKVLNELNVES